MNSPRSTPLIIAAAAALCASPVRADDPGFVPNQVLVRLAPNQPLSAFLTRYNAQIVTSPAPVSIPQRNIHLVTLEPTENEISFVDLLRTDPGVIFVDLNFLGENADPFPGGRRMYLRREGEDYINDPALDTINVPGAHTRSRGDGTIIAVLDSGLDRLHPVFAGRRIVGAYNFVEGNNNISDEPDGLDTNNSGIPDEFAGHGTMVAGLIAKVAPNASLMPVRVMDSDGVTTTYRLAQGIYHAIDAGAHVINISLGTTADPFLLQDAVAEAHSRGILVVASAGNDSAETPARSPASLSSLGVMAIGAVGDSFVRGNFSNYGSWITLNAPGVNIVSTIPVSEGSYGVASGTSFAAPIVSATAALVRSICPLVPPARIRQELLSAALPVDMYNPGYEEKLGAGALRADVTLGVGGPSLTCSCDYDNNGIITLNDLYLYGNSPRDVNGDGATNSLDRAALKGWLRRAERTQLRAR
jgi:subtilisin family serine protease